MTVQMSPADLKVRERYVVKVSAGPCGGAAMIFVGEKPSARAKQLGVTWQSGGLAARPLHEALRAAGLNPASVDFANWFAGGKGRVRRAIREGRIVVAMGRRVQNALTRERIHFIPIIHPAARGTIRKREVYVAHVLAALGDAA